MHTCRACHACVIYPCYPDHDDDCLCCAYGTGRVTLTCVYALCVYGLGADDAPCLRTERR